MMSNFYIGCLNARSLLPSLHEVKNILKEQSFDALFMCETWLGGHISSDILNIDGYRLYRGDRNARGRGLCMYVKNRYNCTIIVENAGSIWEQFWLCVVLNKKKYAMGVIYKPHKQNSSSFLEEFEDSLASIYPTVDEIVCLGDFNLDFLSESTTLNKFNDILELFDVAQIINTPTRITNTSSTLLDYILIREESLVEKGVIHHTVSEHSLVYCKLKIKCKRTPKMCTYRCYKNFVEEHFQNDLRSISFF